MSLNIHQHHEHNLQILMKLSDQIKPKQDLSHIYLRTVTKKDQTWLSAKPVSFFKRLFHKDAFKIVPLQKTGFIAWISRLFGKEEPKRTSLEDTLQSIKETVSTLNMNNLKEQLESLGIKDPSARFKIAKGIKELNRCLDEVYRRKEDRADASSKTRVHDQIESLKIIWSGTKLADFSDAEQQLLEAMEAKVAELDSIKKNSSLALESAKNGLEQVKRGEKAGLQTIQDSVGTTSGGVKQIEKEHAKVSQTLCQYDADVVEQFDHILQELQDIETDATHIQQEVLKIQQEAQSVIEGPSYVRMRSGSVVEIVPIGAVIQELKKTIQSDLELLENSLRQATINTYMAKGALQFLKDTKIETKRTDMNRAIAAVRGALETAKLCVGRIEKALDSKDDQMARPHAVIIAEVKSKLDEIKQLYGQAQKCATEAQQINSSQK